MEEPQVIEDSEDEGALEFAKTPCSVCRSKKRGCDKVKPTCGTCVKRGNEISCSYRPEDMPPPKLPTRGVKMVGHYTSVEAESDTSEPPQTAKMRRRSEPGRFSTDEQATPAKRPRRQRYASTSHEETSDNELKTPDNIQLPDSPDAIDLLRWDMVKIIHDKRDAASLTTPTLTRLLEVLQQDHPSYSEDELQEKAEFSVMLQERKDGGRLSNSDLRALEFILKVPFMDRAAIDAHEQAICLDIFTPSLSGDHQKRVKSWSPAALRLLRRVLRKSRLNPLDEQLLEELNFALETEVSMSRATWQSCMGILSRDSVANQVERSTRSHTSGVEHVSQVHTPEGTVQAKRLSTREPKDPAVTQRPTLSDMLSDRDPILPRSSSNTAPDSKPAFELCESLGASLFEVYCLRDYPLLPIIDLLAFKSYHATSESQRGAIESSLAGPLMFCYALACLGNDDRRVLKHAPTFYQSAQESMPSTKSSGDILNFVQCLVLQSQYLRAVGDFTSAWEVIGLAIRKAHTLGIKANLGKKFDRDGSPNNLPMRLWHSIQMMERSLVLDLGVTYHGLDSIFNTALASDMWANGFPELGEDDQSSIFLSESFCLFHKLHVTMDDLVDYEEELRVSDGQCALQKIKEADLREFMNMEAELESWYESLPTILQGAPAQWDVNQPKRHIPLVDRLRIMLHLRYLYFKIRLYRPLLILGVALSIACACGSGPHMKSQNKYGKNGLSVLTIIRHSSSKCLDLAAQLTDFLWQYKESASLPVNMPACDYAHYAYACGLAMIAARGLHFISTDSKGSEGRVYHAGHFDKILRLLEINKENMEDSKDLSRLFSMCQQALRDISKLAGESDRSALTSEYVDFDKLSWGRLYARTRVTPPSLPHPRLPDVSRLLGWFESLPVDLIA